MIRLVSVSGGGRVDESGNVATVTVRQSDDPISISSDDLVKSGEEGEVININVTRGGRANGKNKTEKKEYKKNWNNVYELMYIVPNRSCCG